MGVGRLRRSSVLVAVLALLVSVVGSAAAAEPQLDSSSKVIGKSKYNSYIVVMKADPLAISEGDALDSGKAKARAKELRQTHAKALRGAGVKANRTVNEYVHALNGFSARITYQQAIKVAASKDVAYIVPDELRQPTTDESGEFLGLSGGKEAWRSGVTGKGVVVGVIDSGIWPEHPSFADNGMPEPPIDTTALPCEFGNTAHNPNDAPFTCNNKLLGARQMLETYRALIGAEDFEFDSARDDNGHGTHTASTAAGNAGVQAYIFGRKVGDGRISGVAPDAHIIAYKGLGTLGGFTSDLTAAIDQAVADGVDVINYSIGGGASTSISSDELAFLFAADAGVFTATSAGNDGPGPGTIGDPAKLPWLTTVGANTQDRFFSGTVQLGNGKKYTGASITLGTDGYHPLVDAADAGDDLCFSDPGLDPEVVEGAIVLCRRGGNARVDKSLAVLEAGGVGMIMYENDDAGNLFTDTHFVPSVHVDNTPGLKIKAYIDRAGEKATARIYRTARIDKWRPAPSMTSFSSRGPNLYDDIIKPDITAPGMQILAGASPMPEPGAVEGQLFQAIAGTSMSSPHVAGLFALLKQVHPEWTPAMARSALMTTADPRVVDNDRTSRATPFEMGAGLVDPGKVGQRGSMFHPGLVYDAGFTEYLGFLCDVFPAVFANPSATCAALAGLGIPTDASDLNYPSIAVGELTGNQTVVRTVTSVATKDKGVRTYRVSVKAPAGYSVSVAPKVLKLKPGESATYAVTITNKSAPAGEWRFGSLTWKSGSYEARSPIAVRGSTIDTVESVSGSGESGSASFDVKFGYTGDYEATAQGLIAATATADNVLQDPDQTFDPADVAAGGANAHPIAVSGASFLRIAVPEEVAEADSDLDVFVFDPAGDLVAESTSPGTNELVSIEDPADGEWTVYVHGWQAPGGDTDYTMYSWVIPADDDPGGSLVIDSAPTSATSGAVGTIQVSWTGATAGQWHFGAVTHTGPGGEVIGRTLVEVDNR